MRAVGRATEPNRDSLLRSLHCRQVTYLQDALFADMLFYRNLANCGDLAHLLRLSTLAQLLECALCAVTTQNALLG